MMYDTQNLPLAIGEIELSRVVNAVTQRGILFHLAIKGAKPLRHGVNLCLSAGDANDMAFKKIGILFESLWRIAFRVQGNKNGLNLCPLLGIELLHGRRYDRHGCWTDVWAMGIAKKDDQQMTREVRRR